MEVADKQYSSDGAIKYLWLLDDRKTVESIYFQFYGQQYICISSQVGCNVKCPFCETGKQRNLRNLTADEMYQQVAMTLSDLGKQEDNHLYQVAVAGMGESLLNFDHVKEAAHHLRVDELTRTVSVSTAGLVPAIRRLVGTDITKLFISLHATTDELRNFLVPVNRKYPILDLLSAARYFYEKVGVPVTVTYLLFDQINDSDEDLTRLRQLLDPEAFILQLSEWNYVSESNFAGSPRTEYFREELATAGYEVFIQRSKGKDIEGGCGQLRSRYVQPQKP